MEKAMSSKLSETSKRIYVGLPLAAGLILLVSLGPSWLLFLAALIFALLGWSEYSKLSQLTLNGRSFYLLGYPGIIIAMCLSYFSVDYSFIALWLFFVLGFASVLNEKTEIKGRANSNEKSNLQRQLSIFCLGQIYIFFLFGFLTPIAKEYGNFLLLYLFVIVLTGDVMAYFVGRKFGRNRLAPALSPSKTWEGAFGSLIGSALGAAAIYCASPLLFGEKPQISLLFLILFAIFASPFSQAGDLLESFIKRWSKQKDSGGIFPGHGGVLDRIDGLFFVSALLYFVAGFFL